jgi:hypothetical protein
MESLKIKIPGLAWDGITENKDTWPGEGWNYLK